MQLMVFIVQVMSKSVQARYKTYKCTASLMPRSLKMRSAGHTIPQSLRFVLVWEPNCTSADALVPGNLKETSGFQTT